MYGNIYDHFSAVFEYPNNVRGYHNCRHWRNTAQQTKDYVLGSKGLADVFGPRNTREPRITGKDGKVLWRSDIAKNNMYQTEHDELFASIRAGKPINNGDNAASTTLLAIMARMAAYTGQVITWEMALNSKEDLSPAEYAWGDIPRPEVARPGITRFV
jgi:predicted dehydrogenase